MKIMKARKEKTEKAEADLFCSCGDAPTSLVCQSQRGVGKLEF